jgi:hypothetical protein
MTSFSRFAITAFLLTLGACHAAPAQAGVGTAAWATAGSIAWGCPECVRELRQEDERLRSAMATAREAVRRLVRWNLQGHDSQVVEGVYLWATLDGMAGPLPPLPERLAKREQLITRLQGDPEASC